MNLFAALLSGVLFGLGLAVSGMVDPARVTGFLDLAGAWDPSLGFVMGGALGVFMPGYFLLIKPRRSSLSGTAYQFTKQGAIDGKLIGGAALFGVGWGMVGICPGPALSLLSSGQPQILLFVLSMAVGLLLVDKVLLPRLVAQRT
ncbi:YeeE/YedE family protein [Aeromonas simiae]|uniref:YeeE/YedE family protein n=1 Tax=Aeromonas simiae TaxID=218936 RepID=A0A5J6WTA8_9GAMM|nr:YeeE/YedE family protein [Aeromonas simiae]QFI54122.1 YeeE/YedE family protein [Aeromonas simiae]